MANSLRITERVNSVTEREELKKRGYHIGRTLGEGSYARVKSAVSVKWKTNVALKIISKRKAPKDFQSKFLPRELEILQTINHPNIIMLLEVMQVESKIYLVMEMAGHGDLLEYIKLRGALPEEKARGMFFQLCSAVDYLHNKNVIHRDLKCENILLDGKNNLKVTDFGFARELLPTDISRTFCGSAAYAPPEILQGTPYTGFAYDIWSMGVIFYIMICGSMPFDDSNISKMIRVQLEKKVGFSRKRKLTDEVKNLCHRMLEVEVSKRITVPGILQHPWMREHLPALQAISAALWKERDELMASRGGSAKQTSENAETHETGQESKEKKHTVDSTDPDQNGTITRRGKTASKQTQTDGCACICCPEHKSNSERKT